MHSRIQTSKAILMSFQTEMKTGRNAILIVKWQQTWLNCFTVLWKRELGSNETGYSAEICRQSIKDAAWVHLTVYSRI